MHRQLRQSSLGGGKEGREKSSGRRGWGHKQGRRRAEVRLGGTEERGRHPRLPLTLTRSAQAVV